MSELKNRIDFVYIFDVQDGNPNGDPDAGNLPRIDAETGIGLVTDVCLKRKVRNYVQIAQAGKAGNDILVKSKEISGEEVFINEEIRKMYKEDLGIELKIKEKAPADKSSAGKIAMCRRFFDVRTFGAVLSTGPNAGQVRGPIQMTFARSQDMIVSAEHALTVCVARDEEKTYESQVGIQGRKATIPYGLYVCHGFISANLAQQTGFSEEDLELFWEALKNMFDVDRSAARGLMSAQKLIVFKHDSILGNAPANIQHFRFCPRQWALIHIEQQWDDNRLTIEGQILHKHVDDPFYRQKCGDQITLRAVNIASRELGLYGISDAIELLPSSSFENTILHPNYPGRWQPVAVEYKHGKPKRNEVDEVQLAAQIMCIEEMYAIHIPYGSFFYGELRHRVNVDITEELRNIVRQCARDMHDIFSKAVIPKAEYGKHCDKCSLKDICMPEMVNNCTSVDNYLTKNLYL